jgi:ABC-2 type transport system permease protein
MASIAEHPSTAAILTLSFTAGTWIVSFLSAVHGGIWERVASYTPAAMVAEFQHGLIRLNVVLVALILTAAGLGFAAIWMRLGVAAARRWRESAVLIGIAAVIAAACTLATPSWDASESRGNSFPEADEQALRQIHEPLRIDVYLAPEDPRRADFEHRALSKLRRVKPRVDVKYESSTSIGLFEQTNPHYGEIWYRCGGRSATSRATTAENALESIYSVCGVAAPVEGGEDVFRGHPLAVAPKGAAAVFYIFWPIVTACAALVARRKYYGW